MNRVDTSMRAVITNNTPTNAGVSNAEVAHPLVITATTPVHRNEIPTNPKIRRGLYPETVPCLKEITEKLYTTHNYRYQTFLTWDFYTMRYIYKLLLQGKLNVSD